MNARQQAAAQAQSIADLIAALTLDYDMLEELREELADLEEQQAELMGAPAGYLQWETANGQRLDGIREELTELERVADGCADADEARDRIMEDPLSIETRSGWVSVGEEMIPEEYRIVLCTGGPHVEIVGDLDQHGAPCRVRIVYRDWGESGELFDFDHDAVLAYAQQFFG